MARLRARRHLPGTSLALGSLARAGPGDGPRARSLGRLPKGAYLSRGQVAPSARRQGPIRDGADAGPHQSPDRVADGLAHAPDLPVAPFVNGDPGRMRAQKGDASAIGKAILELDAATEPADGLSGQTSLDLDDVLLQDTEARVGEMVRQFAVVGQDQKPLGHYVEPADREDAGHVGQEIEHSGPALGVERAGETTPSGLLSR